MSFEENFKMYAAKAKEYAKTYWWIIAVAGYFVYDKYGKGGKKSKTWKR